MLATSVPGEAVDDAAELAGRQARRRADKLPPHVMVYFAMAMALFADEGYEEVAARLAGPLAWWGCWDSGWSVRRRAGLPGPGSGWDTRGWRGCSARSRSRWRAS